MANLEDRGLTGFDPDFSPENPVNAEAAAQRNLTYDSKRGAYVDGDECLRRDRFGQSY